MTSPTETSRQSSPVPVAPENERTNSPRRQTASLGSYPSPTPSATPQIPSPGALAQIAAKSASDREARDGGKSIFGHNKEVVKKRKKHSGSSGRRCVKKRKAADGSGSGQPIPKRNPDDFHTDERMQLVMTGANLDDPQVLQDLRQIYEALLYFGDKVSFVDEKWKLEGLRTPLLHHQLIGVHWMQRRERHPIGPNGGILADEMGLGKSIQLIGCMSQNLPVKGATAKKTLIVAPKRLLAQWYEEIMNHCSNKKMKNVFIYEANRVRSDSEWAKQAIM
jgi:SNF2 family DNA or RNA helicase